MRGHWVVQFTPPSKAFEWAGMGMTIRRATTIGNR